MLARRRAGAANEPDPPAEVIGLEIVRVRGSLGREQDEVQEADGVPPEIAPFSGKRPDEGRQRLDDLVDPPARQRT